MVLTFSGDPFLATRAARYAARHADPAMPEARSAVARGQAGFATSSDRDPEPGRHPSTDPVVRYGEGLRPEDIRDGLAQGGLFGRVTLLLDFDEAFSGQAGVKPRNDAIKALHEVPADALVVVIDSSATESRQKTYRSLGRHQHLPTPRFEKLSAWVAEELRGTGLRFTREVPRTLAELFGEDLPAIASEITKLAVLEDEELTAERVRQVANRPAARDAFKLIEAVARGDAAVALAVARDLLTLGEPPQRVFGALVWQFMLVAKAVGVLQSDPRATPGRVAGRLGAKPRVAERALAIAAGLDEASLRRLLVTLLDADVRSKTGFDAAWALESTVIRLAAAFRPGELRRRVG